MTPLNNARVAGFTFLAYIAAGLSSMMVSARATGRLTYPGESQHVVRQ